MKGVVLALLLASCSPSVPPEDTLQRAQNAIDEGAYLKELLGCKEQAKAAHDTNVYDHCALEVDRKFGVDGKAGP